MLIKKLKKKNLSISTIESLTGGMIGNIISNYDGSSKILKGTLLAYQLEIKNKILKIPMKDMISNDAVSGRVAKQMSIKGINLFNSDISISTTGIIKRYDNRPEQLFFSISLSKSEHIDLNNYMLNTKMKYQYYNDKNLIVFVYHLNIEELVFLSGFEEYKEESKRELVKKKITNIILKELDKMIV